MNITVTHSNRYYYLKDHLGNIRVTVNEFGQAEAYNDYYPFGLQMPGRSVNNAMTDDIYKFGGKELDEESGLNWYYFGARYYDPATGRWLSVDPAITQWSPQRIMAHRLYGLSPYVYVRNNPLNRFDPDGYVDWNKVGWGTLGVVSGLFETGAGAAIAGGTGVTGVGAAAGGALMVHGLATTGFSFGQVIDGFMENDREIPGGVLEATGEAIDKTTGTENAATVGKVLDNTINAVSGGNPVKNVKNIYKLKPASAKEAAKAGKYQLKITKESANVGSQATSTGQAVDAAVSDNEDDEKDKKDE